MDEIYIVEVTTLDGGWRISSLFPNIYTKEEADAIQRTIDDMDGREDFRIRRFVSADES